MTKDSERSPEDVVAENIRADHDEDGLIVVHYGFLVRSIEAYAQQAIKDFAERLLEKKQDYAHPLDLAEVFKAVPVSAITEALEEMKG